MLIVPAGVSGATAHNHELVLAARRARPPPRAADEGFDQIAEGLNHGSEIAIYGGSGCRRGASGGTAVAEKLNARVAAISHQGFPEV